MSDRKCGLLMQLEEDNHNLRLKLETAERERDRAMKDMRSAAEQNGECFAKLREERAKVSALEAVAKAVPLARKAVSDALGGMGNGSPIWSNNPWDKGYCAGITAALSAFDLHMKPAALQPAAPAPDPVREAVAERTREIAKARCPGCLSGLHDDSDRWKLQSHSICYAWPLRRAYPEAFTAGERKEDGKS